MIAFALVWQEELDIKRLQGRLVKRQRTFDIADSQNYVIEHCSLLQNQKVLQPPFQHGRPAHFNAMPTTRQLRLLCKADIPKPARFSIAHSARLITAVGLAMARQNSVAVLIKDFT
jgi:hypothetical protein